MIEYQVVRRAKISDLVDEVNAQIALGWVPLGGVDSFLFEFKQGFIQAMTKETP